MKLNKNLRSQAGDFRIVLHIQFYLIPVETLETLSKLFLASVHHCLDQLHRDAPARYEHPDGIRGHIEE